MGDHSEKILEAVNEIRELIRVMAEPQIAARDKKLSEELIRIVGKSVQKQESILLMNGDHTQVDISKKTGMKSSNLSPLVKQLNEGKLLVGDIKRPKLAILILSTFFENAEKN
jgi:hypothetical protein